jgi:hypothetical protein
VTFESERDACVARLKNLGRAAAIAPAAILFVGLAISMAYGSYVPLAASAFPAVAAFVGLRRRIPQLGPVLDAKPQLWFVAPGSGLVFFDDRGIFIERERELIGYEPKVTSHSDLEGGSYKHERRLASISYEEATHRMKLQLVAVSFDNVQRSRDVHRAIELSLPNDVTPQLALQLAVNANRRAAQLQ